MKVIKLKNLLMLLLFTASLGFTACSDDDDDDKNPATPELGDASAVTTNSFTVNWTAVASADKYLLDVSTAEDFSTTVLNYSHKELEGTAISYAVTGLTPNTKYYYRLYAKKGSSISTASDVKDQTTTAQ